MKKKLLALFLIAALILGGCTGSGASLKHHSSGETWYLGFGCSDIQVPDNSQEPVYIAGYNQGVEILGVLDLCQARAVWIDTGGNGVLVIGIDCVGLDSGTVAKIRKSLSDLPGCDAIHVYSTHTHAGPDTLGLWGPVGIDGKNDAYMQNLLAAAEAAGRAAAADRKPGSLFYGMVETQGMYRDSRNPQVYDENLYRLRFQPENGSRGTQMLFYGAHAEALRGNNRYVSRDYPGLLCDGIRAAMGDEAIFFPGAIGGLIMTKAFVGNADAGPGAVENLEITGQLLLEYALSIEDQRQLEPRMQLSTAEFTVDLDNPVFLLYRSLGILDNRAVPCSSATGYGVKTELSLLVLDGIGLSMIPGEIFPELVYGGSWGQVGSGENPVPLAQLAKEAGLENLLVVGLANDEIGYIVSPSDFLINETLPYLERQKDATGEDHYEETNSVGPGCAQAVAEAFARALEALK